MITGKTTLIEQLIPRFVKRGLKVSLIKHAHHEFDVDQPGKDSYRHRHAGCTEVLVSSSKRWALMHELRGEHEPTFDEQVKRLSPCDLLLVEGFKYAPIAKLEVWRAQTGEGLLHPSDPHIVAVASDAKVQTREAWVDKQDEDFNQFLIMLYVLLALSVIVSIFGMVNTLVLSVYERTRELGMLRAVGMTQGQARYMVRQESVITALIGAALGLPLGVFLAALVTRALQEFDVRFEIPWEQLVVFAIIAVIVGILAAIMPARRAAKLNVLRALQYE